MQIAGADFGRDGVAGYQRLRPCSRIGDYGHEAI